MVHTSTTLAAAAAAFLAMTVAGQTTPGSSSQSLTTTAAPSASSGSTYIPLFEISDSTTLVDSNMAGSIVNVNAEATTIAIHCIEVNSECDGNTITFTQGPSTWAVDYSTKTATGGIELSLSVALDCNIVSRTVSATCTGTEIASASADGEQSVITTSTTETFSGSQIYYNQLLITAGVDKLNSPQATKTPGAAAVVAAPLPTGNVGMGVGGMAAAAIVAVAGMF